MKKHSLSILWAFAIISLFFYSYTQVDLSLTLNQTSLYQTIQKHLQYIGYFERPLSSVLFVSVITLLTTSYAITLYKAGKKQLSQGYLWKITIASAILLTFSYNAFSYDIFNYIFDAKIVTHYQLNPYMYKALDFPADPMLSFMRWTHRVYPYGPAWLGVSIPVSYLGFGYFLPTFLLFKSLASASYLAIGLAIMGISKVIKEKDSFPFALFMLNPLVITEILVSAHNDALMIALLAFATYLLLANKKTTSLIAYLLSVGVKFLTAPAAISFFFRQNEYRFFLTMTIALLASTAAATLNTNFQPWYMLYPLLPAAFLYRKKYILIPFLVLTVSSLFQYLPFIYRGDYNPPIPQIMNAILIISIAVSLFASIIFSLKKTL